MSVIKYFWSFVRYPLSYFVPCIVEKKQGETSPWLEVSMNNGKYMLDSSNVNYSYGGLHTLFRNIFKKYRIGKRKFDHVLILGFGAGSVVSILYEEYKIPCKVTAVENDKAVIELGRKYFHIDRFQGLELVYEDAFNFVLNCRDKFDVIVIDLFVDNCVPAVFESEVFLEGVKKILSVTGIVFFNKIVGDEKTKNEAGEYVEKFRKVFGVKPEVAVFRSGQFENWVFSYDKSKTLK